MAVGKILNNKEESMLVKLIGQVEERTTGEIRIHIAKRTSRRGALADAAAVFKRLKMHATEEHNGVLIFVGLKTKDLACIGDKGIHEKVGDEAWKGVVDQMRANFGKGDFFIGLKDAVEAVGELLARHYPIGDKTSANVLKNTISSD